MRLVLWNFVAPNCGMVKMQPAEYMGFFQAGRYSIRDCLQYMLDE